MGEEHRVEAAPWLVVTKHEKRHHYGPTQHQHGQESACGSGNLQPGRGLSPAEVREVVEEEAGDWHKVGARPRVPAVPLHRLDPRRHGRKHRDGDAEDVEDAESEHPGFPEDGLQRRDGGSASRL